MSPAELRAPQAILLRPETSGRVCHQGVLEKLLQGNEWCFFTLWSSRKGEIFLGMSAPRRCAVDAVSSDTRGHWPPRRRLSRRIRSSRTLSSPDKHSPGTPLWSRSGGLSVLKRKFVVSLGGSSRRDSRDSLRLQGTKLRGARKHRTFVPIGQRFICTCGEQNCQKCCLRNHAKDAGTSHVVWKGHRNSCFHSRSI